MKNRKEGRMSNEWKMVQLGDCTTITMGQSPESSSYNTENDGLPFYQGNADFGILNPTVRYYCNKPSKFAYYNDVLMSVRAPVGALNVANNDCCIGRGLCAISEKAGVSFYKYIFYNLLYNQPYIQSLGVGSTFKAISGKIILNLSIPLPSIEKQREIAEVLDKASELVEKRKAQLAELDLLAESVFYDMFGDPFTNPKGWQKKLLSMLYTVTSSKRIYQSQLAENGIPFYKISDLIKKIDEQNITNTVFISEELYNEFWLNDLVPKEKDILITSRGTLGRCYIVTQDDKFYFQDGMISWLKNSTNQILNQYLVFLFNSEYIKMQINQDSNGATVNYLSIDSLRKLNIILPPIELQQQFAERVEKIEEQKTKVKTALKESENLFQRLMQDMFNPEYHNS